VLVQPHARLLMELRARLLLLLLLLLQL